MRQTDCSLSDRADERTAQIIMGAAGAFHSTTSEMLWLASESKAALACEFLPKGMPSILPHKEHVTKTMARLPSS